MSDFKKFGDGDPRLQLCIDALVATTGANINELADHYDFDVGFAVMATVLGTLAGSFEATFKRHQDECENCAKKKWDMYQLVVKNFGAAFGHEKRLHERETADAVAAADAALEAILRKHKP